MGELSHAMQERLDKFKRKVPSASKTTGKAPGVYVSRKDKGDDPSDYEAAKEASLKEQQESWRYR